MTHDSLVYLSDHALLAEVKGLAEQERCATARLIAALAELDARRLYLGEGCSSLFTYCTQVFHLSEHAAYGRIEAARAARRFPVIVELLTDGALTLTTVGLLAPHLTPDNHPDVLAAARRKSKREVEHLSATRCSSPRRVRPMTSSAGRRTFDRALTLLLSHLEKAKLAATERPRPPRPAAARSRHIPAAVKREVWTRDGGRCAFVGSSGRCTERGLLEFHHVVPFAAGGEAVADNIQVRCKAHNAYEADRYFGPRQPTVVRESTGPAYSVRTEVIKGAPNPRHTSTSYVERQNLTMRMSMRRFTRRIRPASAF